MNTFDFRVCIAAVISVLAVGPALSAPRHAAHRRPNAAPATAPFEQKSSGTAHAVAPRDWEISASAQGNAVDLNDPNKTMYAGWGMTAIDRSMQAYYGNMYGDPATSELTLAGMIAKAQGDSTAAHYTSKPAKFGDGYFTKRSFATGKKAGALYYHIYPDGPNVYIQSVFFAMADKPIWAKKSAMITNVALSIRSAVTLDIPQGDGWSTADHSNPGGSKDTSEENKAFKDYNMQLGTQWFHDSNGDIYDLSVSDDYWPDGPDGPGYYRRAGNGYEKLQPGAD